MTAGIEPTFVIYGEFGMRLGRSRTSRHKIRNSSPIKALQSTSRSLIPHLLPTAQHQQSAALLNCVETSRFWAFSHNELAKEASAN